MSDFTHSSTGQGQASAFSSQEASTGAPNGLAPYTHDQPSSSEFVLDSGSFQVPQWGIDHRVFHDHRTVDAIMLKLLHKITKDGRVTRWPSAFTLYSLWKVKPHQYTASYEELSGIMDFYWKTESEETKQFFRDKVAWFKAEYRGKRSSHYKPSRRERAEPRDQQASNSPSTSQPFVAYSQPGSVAEGSSVHQRGGGRAAPGAQRAYNPYSQAGRIRVADVDSVTGPSLKDTRPGSRLIELAETEGIAGDYKWLLDAKGLPMVVDPSAVTPLVLDSLAAEGDFAFNESWSWLQY